MVYEVYEMTQDLCFISEVQHGLAIDAFPEVHPDMLQYYHGVISNQIQNRPNQTRAGHPSDEETDSDSDSTAKLDIIDSSDDSGLPQAIASHIHANIYHKPVQVPCSHLPFSDMTNEVLFKNELK